VKPRHLEKIAIAALGATYAERFLANLKLADAHGEQLWPPYRPIDPNLIVRDHFDILDWRGSLALRDAARRRESERVAAYYDQQFEAAERRSNEEGRAARSK